MTELRFFRHATLPPPSSGWELVAASINDEDECLCLWSAGGKHRITRGPEAAADGCEVDVSGVRYPAIGQLLDGGFLITDTRMRVDRRTGKRLPVSSWTFSSSGQRAGEGSLGDGIQHVLTTPKGDIWVGYFDEGVYGGGPIEHHGLVRFGPDLEPRWLFPYGEEHGVIDDCYALNASGETATAYFYSDFNIVQVRGDTLSSWGGAPAGAHGLLVDGNRCVLVGGYQEARDRVTHLQLTSEGAQLIGRGRIEGLPNDDRPTVRICRGADMHVIVGTEWFRGSIAQPA